MQATVYGHNINMAFVADKTSTVAEPSAPQCSLLPQSKTEHFKTQIVKHTRQPSNKSSGA